MTTKVTVPQLGESVVEATIGVWMKEEGETVEIGDVLVSLETDKVDVEVGAETSGVLAQIQRQEGEDVQIGDVIAIIEEKGEAPAKDAEADLEAAEGETEVEVREEEEQPAAKPRQRAEMAEAKSATPVARRVAADQGIDLEAVEGTGPQGRVTRQDLDRFAQERKAARADKPAPKPSAREERPAAAPGREERIRMSRRRRTIASRLVEAQQTAAMLTTFNEIDMSAVIDIRKRHRDTFQERHGVKLGFMSFFVKAAVGALKAFPRLNAEIQEDEIVLKHYYDIGMAVGAEEGLVVPVLRDADGMSFAAIESEIKGFVEKVRNKSLTLDDLRGGSFTITNGGVFGSLLSTPILNLPQVAILGLHKIEERPVAVDGEVVVRPMMYVALSYDHRIVDGQEAVQFLVRVKELIENPETMLLEG